jgi:hypothetical protein
MSYFKSAIVGVITALLAVLIVVFVMLRIEVSEGSGAMFVSLSSWQILAAALVGFVAGFRFTLRRARMRHA